jgi:hypothetical protein
MNFLPYCTTWSSVHDIDTQEIKRLSAHIVLGNQFPLQKSCFPDDILYAFMLSTSSTITTSRRTKISSIKSGPNVKIETGDLYLDAGFYEDMGGTVLGAVPEYWMEQEHLSRGRALSCSHHAQGSLASVPHWDLVYAGTKK